MLRKLFLIAALALLPQVALAKVGGDVNAIPQEPAAYTVVCLPDNFATDPQSQLLLRSFSIDTALVGLRNSTTVQLYTASDPDFKHRWAARLPEVSRDGKLAVIVVQDGKTLFGTAANSSDEIVANVKAEGLLTKINLSAGCRFLHPKTTCPTTCSPKHEEPEERSPLRPILGPILKETATKVVEDKVERDVDASPLGLVAIVFAAMTPATLLIGAGSYLVTRSIDENEERDE